MSHHESKIEAKRSETLWRRLTQGVRRLRERCDWEGFVGTQWADRIMAVDVTDRFHAKQGRSTGRWIIEADGRRLAVYLKRHYRLSWWRGLLAVLWPSRDWSPAFQEWQHLEWARAQGMPVPAAVAAAEYIGPWGQLQSFLAVEELSGMLPLHEAIPAAAERLAPEDFQRWKRGLIQELARLVRDLHQRHYFHKDLYLCHFYIPENRVSGIGYRVSGLGTQAADSQTPNLHQGSDDSFHGQVHMIDLHRLGHHSWTRLLWQVKDLAQFLYSSEIQGVNARDRLRFWRAYLGDDRNTWAGRWLRRFVLLKWRRYRQHNAKRKQLKTEN